jgi:uncharacterized membrane protein
MGVYTLLLFGHVLSAIAWLGGGITMTIFTERAAKSGDVTKIRNLIDDAADLGKKFFGPASGLTLLFGLLLVFNGDWGFDHWFIVGGLTGFVISAVVGFGFIDPAAQTLNAELESSGGVMTEKATATLNRIRMISRFDLVSLIIVVFLMTNKPGS